MRVIDERSLGEVRRPTDATIADVTLRPLALVHLAVDSEDSRRLLAAAGIELGQPLGLVGIGGEALGHAPDNEHGQRALAVAKAAATTGVVAPSGWRVMPIGQLSSCFGFLAVATTGEEDAASWPLLELLATLLGEQLKRAALLRTQTTAFVQRLVSDAHMSGERARQEASALGLGLAEAYWPALLVWRRAPPQSDLVEAIEPGVRNLVSGSLTATLDNHIVLLHPSGEGTSNPFEWFEQAVRRMRAVAPSARAQAIAAEGAVELGELSAHVASLAYLGDFGPRAEHDQPVVSARQYALDSLLRENVATPDAQSFVRDRLGVLIAWDQQHHTDLLRVLEAALDLPRHDQAASRCFMHRNTFRHRLRQATQVLGDSLEDADVRLAVHVALKMRRALVVER